MKAPSPASRAFLYDGKQKMADDDTYGRLPTYLLEKQLAPLLWKGVLCLFVSFHGILMVEGAGFFFFIRKEKGISPSRT